MAGEQSAALHIGALWRTMFGAGDGESLAQEPEPVEVEAVQHHRHADCRPRPPGPAPAAQERVHLVKWQEKDHEEEHHANVDLPVHKP